MMPLSSRHAPALDLPARFMIVSMLSLVTSAAVSPFALELLSGAFTDFKLLAFVHLMTLGFLGSMLIGASYQLVPVALQSELPSVSIGRASFWAYATGLITFLAGLIAGWTPGLGIGGTLLAIAFMLYIWQVTVTFVRAPKRDAVAWHIVSAAALSGVGMTLGLLLAFNKSNGMLAGETLRVLAAHIVVMFIGWAGLTFTGVAYKLVGMFTLAEKHLDERLAATEGLLLGLGTAGLAGWFLLGGARIVGLVAALAVLVGLLVFAAQLAIMYRRRMRRSIDIHMPFAIVAVASMLVAAFLLAIGLVRGANPADTIWVVAIWLALWGGFATAIQGFFYKIATFLVWLRRYSPIAGRRAVPRLDEMYHRTVGLVGLVLWGLGVVVVPILLITASSALPWASLPLLAGSACFLFNVVTIARHWIAGQATEVVEPAGSSIRLRQGTIR